MKNISSGGNKPPSPAQNPVARKLAFTPKKALPPQLRNLIRRLQKNYPFFSDMGEDEVGEVLRLCKRESFDVGAKIFSEGDMGDSFFLIVAGAVGIVVGGKEVARMGPGQVFGEMAMLDSAPRTATAIVLEPAILFSVQRNVLATRIPALGFKVVVGIARQLSNKLREANEQIKAIESQAG